MNCKLWAIGRGKDCDITVNGLMLISRMYEIGGKD